MGRVHNHRYAWLIDLLDWAAEYADLVCPLPTDHLVGLERTRTQRINARQCRWSQRYFFDGDATTAMFARDPERLARIEAHRERVERELYKGRRPSEVPDE